MCPAGVSIARSHFSLHPSYAPSSVESVAQRRTRSEEKTTKERFI
jgi:hypothetical protein